MNFEELAAKYAEVAVQVGVNIQKGQRLYIQAPIDAPEFTRATVREAYKAGASYVYVDWYDPYIGRERLLHADEDTLTEYPEELIAIKKGFYEAGSAILSIGGQPPDVYEGIDPMRIKTVVKASSEVNKAIQHYTTNMEINWSIVAVPSDGWATKVYPDLSVKEARARLWEAIFTACRIDQPDPAAAWEAHSNDLIERAKELTAKGYRALHYTAPGTDLRIGLPEGHVWVGGGGDAQNGVTFVPNIPTEELFTLPHREQVDGVVTATKPLPYAGTLVENFSLRFENGQVVEANAEKGQEALETLLDTDDGARYLGEVALVSVDSGVARADTLFYNILYDENAASHVALGRAYGPINLPRAAGMTDDEMRELGVNTSMAHTDFMIGSTEMDIDGETADGSLEPVMRNGAWAF